MSFQKVKTLLLQLLLSVRGEVVDSDDHAPKFALLWTSPEFVDERGEEVPKKRF
jgi:hypothetical protein